GSRAIRAAPSALASDSAHGRSPSDASPTPHRPELPPGGVAPWPATVPIVPCCRSFLALQNCQPGIGRGTHRIVDRLCLPKRQLGARPVIKPRPSTRTPPLPALHEPDNEEYGGKTEVEAQPQRDTLPGSPRPSL